MKDSHCRTPRTLTECHFDQSGSACDFNLLATPVRRRALPSEKVTAGLLVVVLAAVLLDWLGVFGRFLPT